MTNFERVRKFMEIFSQEIKKNPSFPDEKITTLRYDLIKEELEELKEAVANRDIKEVADALTDILRYIWCRSCFRYKSGQMFYRSTKFRYE